MRDLKITAFSNGGAWVCVSGVQEDRRNHDVGAGLLRFHGPRGSLVVDRRELFALIYERQGEDEDPTPAAPAVIPDQDLIRFPGLRGRLCMN